jgi:hypothetical protein
VTGAGSRNKGSRWELEVARRFRDIFPDHDVRRGLQARGGHEAPDVDVPGFWLETKHHRKVNLRAALAQAVNDAAATPDRAPVAICKDNHAAPIVVLRFDDFLALVARARLVASAPVATGEVMP